MVCRLRLNRSLTAEAKRSTVPEQRPAPIGTTGRALLNQEFLSPIASGGELLDAESTSGERLRLARIFSSGGLVTQRLP